MSQYAKVGSTARTIVLIALTLHFISLWFPYQTNTYKAEVQYDTRSSNPGTGSLVHNAGTSERKGFELLSPAAPYILGGLFFLYLLYFNQHPLWGWWGYVITVGLVAWFAMRNPTGKIEGTGGLLALISGVLLCIATLTRIFKGS